MRVLYLGKRGRVNVYWTGRGSVAFPNCCMKDGGSSKSMRMWREMKEGIMSRANSTIRILIVDDQPVMRLGLETLLGEVEDMSVVDSAESYGEALMILHRSPVDVVVLDMRVQAEDGLLLLEELQQMKHAPSAVVYTRHQKDERMVRAKNAGAKGYVSKLAPEKELLDTIREAFFSMVKSYTRQQTFELYGHSVL